MNKKKETAARPQSLDRSSGNGRVDHLTEQNVEAILRMEEAAKGERTRSDLVAVATLGVEVTTTFNWKHE
jgi:hypothetical protein